MEVAQTLIRDRLGADATFENECPDGTGLGPWRADDLISAVVARVVETGETPAAALEKAATRWVLDSSDA